MIQAKMKHDYQPILNNPLVMLLWLHYMHMINYQINPFLAYTDQFINCKDGYRKQMITYKEEECEWDKSLILYKGVSGVN